MQNETFNNTLATPLNVTGMLGEKPGEIHSVSDALALYQKLRDYGQKPLLARLSVEARCSQLAVRERKLVQELLLKSELPQ